MKYFFVSFRRSVEIIIFNILDLPFFYEPPMNKFKCKVLNRLFGSRISDDVLLLNGVRILFPENLSVGRYSYISYGSKIEARAEVTIGEKVTIAPEVFISTGDHAIEDLVGMSSPVRIKDGVFIGARAMILSGVTVGEHSIIGAGAVVTKDVPPCCIVAGVPAKIIKRRDKVERVWTVFGEFDVSMVENSFDS